MIAVAYKMILLLTRISKEGLSVCSHVMILLLVSIYFAIIKQKKIGKKKGLCDRIKIKQENEGH